MTNKLVGFALAKTFYSEKKNLLEPFYPFILEALKGFKKETTAEELSKELENLYDLHIPLNTLYTIVDSLYRQSFLDLNRYKLSFWTAQLLDEGERFLIKINESRQNIEQRQTKLFNSFNLYCSSTYNKEYRRPEYNEMFYDYIKSNLNNLAIFDFSHENSNNKISEFDIHFTNFLISINESEVELMSTFNDLIRGAVLWTLISRKDNIDELSNFNNLTVYLDTNIIFSILGFHHPSINNAANELLKIMIKNNKIKLKVLSITLEEMTNLLRNYKNYKFNYTDVPVNSIYYFLRKKGFDDSQIDILIDDLPELLLEKNIELEIVKPIDHENLSNKELEYFNELYRNKLFNNDRLEAELRKNESSIYKSTIHDYSVINFIQKSRPRWFKSLEKCEHIFLTSSYYLSKFCEQMSAGQYFPEVIRDTTLTNILWLKNPGDDIGISVHNVISVHANQILIDNNLWRKFIFVLNKLQKEEKINHEEYARLISNNQITYAYLSSSTVYDISPDSVLDLNEKFVNELEKNTKALNHTKTTMKEQATQLKLYEEKLKFLTEEINSLKKSKEEDELYRRKKQYITSEKNKILKNIIYSLLFFSIGFTIVIIIDKLNFINNIQKESRLVYLKYIIDFILILVLPPLLSFFTKKINKDTINYLFRKKTLEANLEQRFLSNYKA